MYFELKENKVHGTKEFPYVDYHVLGIKQAFQIPVHWHREIELIYVISSPFKLIIEGREYAAQSGDIFIVNPGELHFMGSRNKGANYHTFVFPLELISFQSEDSLETDFFLPLRTGKSKFLNQLPNEMHTPEMDMLFQKLIAANELPLEKKQFEIRILLLCFFQMINKSDMMKDVAHTKQDLGREIITYLQQNYTTSISLATLSNHLHLSEKYISRYFKQAFHLNLSQYVNHLRTVQAKHLLETTELPVTEVALQSGFSNVSYFVRSFHKSVGMSPLQYRKSIQGS